MRMMPKRLFTLEFYVKFWELFEGVWGVVEQLFDFLEASEKYGLRMRFTFTSRTTHTYKFTAFPSSKSTINLSWTTKRNWCKTAKGIPHSPGTSRNYVDAPVQIPGLDLYPESNYSIFSSPSFCRKKRQKKDALELLFEFNAKALSFQTKWW